MNKVKLFRESGKDLAFGLLPVILGVIVYLVFKWSGASRLGVLFFLIVTTIGMIVVSIFNFVVYKDSWGNLLANIFVVIAITIFLFAWVFHTPIVSENDYMALNGQPRNLTYEEAYYFSTVTLTTLGYGDITPNGFFRGFAATEAFLGFLYLGIFISGITLVLVRGKLNS